MRVVTPMTESRLRSLLKAISWRIVATGTTVLLVLMFTGDVGIAFTVGGVEAVAKIVIYYLHERTWQAFSWGTGGSQSVP